MAVSVGDASSCFCSNCSMRYRRSSSRSRSSSAPSPDGEIGCAESSAPPRRRAPITSSTNPFSRLRRPAIRSSVDSVTAVRRSSSSATCFLVRSRTSASMTISHYRMWPSGQVCQSQRVTAGGSLPPGHRRPGRLRERVHVQPHQARHRVEVLPAERVRAPPRAPPFLGQRRQRDRRPAFGRRGDRRAVLRGRPMLGGRRAAGCGHVDAAT